MKSLVMNIVILETGLDRSIRSNHRSNIDAMFDALSGELHTFDSLKALDLETSCIEERDSYNPDSLLRTGKTFAGHQMG